MLTGANAKVASYDEKMPGMALLLDPDAFTEALRRARPDVKEGSLRATYLRYKPKSSLLAAYRMQSSQGQTDLYAKAYRLGSRKFKNARDSTGSATSDGTRGWCWDHLAVCVYPFPCDRQVSALASIIDGEKRALLLREIVPNRPELWQAALEPLRYKPETHYVGKLSPIAAEPAILRVCGAERLASVIRGAEAFVSRGPLRISRLIGVSKRQCVVVQEHLSGLNLDRAIRDPSWKAQTMTVVGAALAELHGQKAGPLMDKDPDQSAQKLLRRAELIGCIDAETGRYATVVAQRFAAGLVDTAYERRPIHGDFSPNQVLFTDDSAGICDTETAALGDPAADLGCFISYMERLAMGGVLSDAQVEAFREALLSGYRHAKGRPISARVELWVAAYWLRQAYLTFRRVKSKWPERVVAALARAEIALDNYARLRNFRSLPEGGHSQSDGEATCSAK